MSTAEPRDRMDPRVCYLTYAIAALVGGVALIIRGPSWFSAAVPAQPWATAAVVRILGALAVLAGCFGAALAATADPIARRRTYVWFLAGNAVLFFIVLGQGRDMWSPDRATDAAFVLLAVVIFGVGAGLEERHAGRAMPAHLTSLFGGTPQTAIHELRSRYEQQIHDAAAQEERNRLARDLHDSIKQQVFAIQTAAATAQVRYDVDPAGAKAAIDQVRTSAREAMIEMEVMLDQLRARPLENVGLVEALKKQCEALAFRTGANVDFRPGALPPSDAFAPGAHETILRVAQEALANVSRHSRARDVRVVIDSADGRTELKIADDGAGFDPNMTTAGMGLANMRQRAVASGGHLEASSQPGHGTTVTLSLPYQADARGRARRHLVFAIGWGAVILLYLVAGLRNPRTSLVLAVCFLPMLFSEVHLYLRLRRRPGAV